jgi:hypothetical protein
MTKVIPATLADVPRLDEAQPGHVVEFEDWNDVNEAMNYEFASDGAIVGGQVYEEPWTTTSAGYTTVNENGTDADLEFDDWNGLFKFQRLIHGSATAGPAYEMFVFMFARNLDMRVNLTRFDGGPLTTFSSTPFSWTTFTGTGDSEWVGTAIEFSEAAASEGGAGPNITDPNTWFLVDVEARISGAATGFCWQFGIRETKINSGTKLPRGP